MSCQENLNHLTARYAMALQFGNYRAATREAIAWVRYLEGHEGRADTARARVGYTFGRR